MARPKSEDKRNDILTAATRIIAEKGLTASTAEISKTAGIAEGTLFIYFKTKDELLNTVYRQIKLELADAMMSNYPRKLSVRHRLQHVWDCFVNWGVANPSQRKALLILDPYERVSAESRGVGNAPFVEIHMMAQDAVNQGLFRKVSLDFVLGTLRALAQHNMDFISAHPKMAEEYRRLGFETFWAGIERRRG